MFFKTFIKVVVLCMVVSLPALTSARGVSAICNYGFASREPGQKSVCQQVDGSSSSGKFFTFFCNTNSCGANAGGDTPIPMSGCQLQSEVAKNPPGSTQLCKAYGPAPSKIRGRNSYSCTSISGGMYYCPRDVGVAPHVSCGDCQTSL